ncbi:hypothetical protein [Marinovum algicola]
MPQKQPGNWRAALAGSAKDSTGCALPVCQPASANGASSAAG